MVRRDHCPEARRRVYALENRLQEIKQSIPRGLQVLLNDGGLTSQASKDSNCDNFLRTSLGTNPPVMNGFMKQLYLTSTAQVPEKPVADSPQRYPQCLSSFCELRRNHKTAVWRT